MSDDLTPQVPEPPYVISPSSDILASQQPPSPPRWGRRLAVGGAGLAVLALAGGGFAAYGALSGGGTQPEKFVPANAVAYVELDLNPPVSQKVNAVRLLHKLPKSSLKTTSDNYKDLLLSAAFSSDKEINYATDIDPWLGDRIAVAVLPPVAGGQPTVEAVLQVKDEAAFKRAAPKLFKDNDGGYVLRDGFAIVSQDSDLAQRVSDAAAKSDLADDADYNLDTKDLGDRVVTGWYDASRLIGILPKATLTPALAQDLKGRGTLAVHVEANAVELVVNQTGGLTSTSGHAALIPKLPTDTVAALEVTGAGANVVKQWDQVLQSLSATGVNVTSMINTYEHQYNLKLPDDLGTLLGTDTLAAVTVAKADQTPAFGYLAVTDKAKAQELLGRLSPTLSHLGAPLPTVTGDRIAWGTSPTWAKDAGSGDLGGSAIFKDALPDVASAQFAVYVNLGTASGLGAAQALGGAVASVQDVGLQALGITATTDGATSHLRIRVTVK
jgi:Protein of unknown function (DUF3352)